MCVLCWQTQCVRHGSILGQNQLAISNTLQMTVCQVYDEEGVDRTPKQLAQRQMVHVRPPPQAALPGLLPGGARVPGGSILGRHHRESRMSSRVSKLSKHSAVP